MHPLLLDKLVALCNRRASQGDCPQEPAASVESLEHAVIQLSSYVRALAAETRASASIPPKAAVQDKTDDLAAEFERGRKAGITQVYDALAQGAQAGAEPLRPLTDEQIYAIAEDFDPQESYVVFARAILAARGALAEPQAEPRNQDQELQDHPAVPPSTEKNRGSE